MEAKRHQEYKKEEDKLKQVVRLIDDEMNMYANYNYKNCDDSIVENLIKAHNKKTQELKKAENAPYFGRIDFNDSKSNRNEELYIGKTLVMENDCDPVVLDWRAPIASLYYDGNIGNVSYECPDGIMSGEMLLKRSYKINEKKLQDISDVDIVTNDEMLIESLKGNKDDKLKDIVTTIQSEQNKIIRAEMKTSLIVQGVAGSGKTTIALHRIAYLVYTYQKRLKPEDFMIIAPNKLFLNYIADVLPDLGVDDVNQTTFEELTLQLINEKIKIKDADQKLSDIIEKDENESQNLKLISKLKASMKYKEAIDLYIEGINKFLIPDKDFEFEGIKMFEKNQIEKLFNEDYNKHSSLYRIEEIKKYILNKFDIYEMKIKSKINNNAKNKIDELKQDMADTPERQKLIIEVMNSKQEKIKKLTSIYKKSVNDYLAGPNKSIIKYYMDFVKDEEVFTKYLKNDNKFNVEIIKECQKYTKTLLEDKEIEIEDLAAIMYLKNKLHGIDKVKNIKQVVIDEAQDIGIFQYYVLKDIMQVASFTILGDIAQGINEHRGTANWSNVRDIVFEGNCNILNLQQSYRTTVEIMQAANTVIDKTDDDNIILANPVLRHGENVKVIEKKNNNDIILEITEKIKKLKEKSKSIAIICKDMVNCKDIYSKLSKNNKNIKLLKNKEEYYNGGIVVVPSYLSKGLEFDSIIIPDANKNNYKQNNLDIKLLYVSMTRALHHLDIYYQGEKSELIKHITSIS